MWVGMSTDMPADMHGDMCLDMWQQRWQRRWQRRRRVAAERGTGAGSADSLPPHQQTSMEGRKKCSAPRLAGMPSCGFYGHMAISFPPHTSCQQTSVRTHVRTHVCTHVRTRVCTLCGHMSARVCAHMSAVCTHVRTRARTYVRHTCLYTHGTKDDNARLRQVSIGPCGVDVV